MFDSLEPNSTQLNKYASIEASNVYAMTSIAISLKRIADYIEKLSLEKTIHNVDLRTT